MTAHRAVGEVAVVFEGHPFTLRPSFRALSVIEEATGKTIGELAARLRECVERGVIAKGVGLSLRDMAQIVSIGYRETRDVDKALAAAMTPEKAGDMIVGEGANALLIPLLEFLMIPLAGAETARDAATVYDRFLSEAQDRARAAVDGGDAPAPAKKPIG